MYPATPGADTLAVHGPQFPSVLHPAARRQHHHQLRAAAARYVQGLKVNGAATSHNYLRYPDIAAGGTLDFTMGAHAQRTLGHRRRRRAAVLHRRRHPGAGRARAWAPTWRWASRSPAPRPCAATEAAAKAVDGTLKNNSKWCSQAASPTPARSTSARPRPCRRSWSSTPASAARTPAGTPAPSRSRPAPTAPPGPPRPPSPASRSSRTYHPVSARHGPLRAARDHHPGQQRRQHRGPHLRTGGLRRRPTRPTWR